MKRRAKGILAVVTGAICGAMLVGLAELHPAPELPPVAVEGLHDLVVTEPSIDLPLSGLHHPELWLAALGRD